MIKQGMRYIQLSPEEFTEGLAFASANSMGHEYGVRSDELGTYIELMPENRTDENIAGFEAALGGS